MSQESSWPSRRPLKSCPRILPLLGFDLDDLEAKNKLVVDYVHIDKSEIEETGEYDLEGLFIRLGLAIDSIGAKRVALDTLGGSLLRVPERDYTAL